MADHVIIDGNNLLHAMHDHAPVAHVGRETLVRVVERWAHKTEDRVTLVFDGSMPREGLARQMMSSRITVEFSGPVTADDVIIQMVHRAGKPGTIRVVTADTAIRHEAKRRRCKHTHSAAFVGELYPNQERAQRPVAAPDEKPPDPSPDETQEWLDMFKIDGRNGPDDQVDAMFD